jgi:hypothetical protein
VCELFFFFTKPETKKNPSKITKESLISDAFVGNVHESLNVFKIWSPHPYFGFTALVALLQVTLLDG